MNNWGRTGRTVTEQQSVHSGVGAGAMLAEFCVAATSCRGCFCVSNVDGIPRRLGDRLTFYRRRRDDKFGDDVRYRIDWQLGRQGFRQSYVGIDAKSVSIPNLIFRN